MSATVARWGNSLAVRLPKAVLDAAGLAEGDSLVVESSPKGVLLRRAARPTLAGLVDAITSENVHAETRTGKARGNEHW